MVTLELSQINDNAEIIVTNVAGAIINRMETKTLRTTIDMSNHASGSYFIKVFTGNNAFEVKLIKQ
jgi:hypothetical protein